MTEALEEAYQSSSVPPAGKVNWKSIIGLLPAGMLYAMAYSSFFNHSQRDDYTPLGYIWSLCGLALVVVSMIGIRTIRFGEKSDATSFIMFGWACLSALLGFVFLAGGPFPHNAWLGFGYVMMTMMLMNLGAIIFVWDSLTGIFGAYAKAIIVAMGSAGIIAAGVWAWFWIQY
ncbi:MAG: hypothetical protein ABIE25_08935 [Thermoplasmatota archaeon]|nr:hypothetical protein [Candidatus Thermoplasmatota archaeon]MBU1913661.1 hypothetical protein [Candidatus Thermoplasmatota archaeon]